MIGMQKGILLYTGYWGYNGTKYYNPTDEELQNAKQTLHQITGFDCP